MDLLDSNKISLTTKVTVAGIDRDFVVMEIQDSQERIFWPLQELPENLRANLKAGDKLNLELKPNAESAIQTMVNQAKNSFNKEDLEAKRKLLEKLIN